MGHRHTVALLGPEGSFSDEAALKFKADFYYAKDFADIFRRVLDGTATAGFVPIHNTTHGDITEVKKLLKKHKKNISLHQKVRHSIELYLAAKKKLTTEEIRTLYISRYVKPKCIEYLSIVFKKAKIRIFLSSAEALKKAKKSKTAAAIGSALGIKKYKLKILASNIEDKRNTTTFILFSSNQDQKE